MGMALQYISCGHHTDVLPLFQPLFGPCFSTGRGAPRTSVPACCRHDRCLQHRLGRYMQRAGSLGALDRAPTALAHKMPSAVGSASGFAAVPATAVRQARVGPHWQHWSCLIHQPTRRSTITSHVTTRPPSPPLQSDAAQVNAHHPHSGGAQSCGRCALMTAHIPRRMATPSRDDPADLESIWRSPGGPVCFTASCIIPWPRPPSARTRKHTAGLGRYASMRFPRWACSHRHSARSGRTRNRSCRLHPTGPPGPGFQNSCSSRQPLPWQTWMACHKLWWTPSLRLELPRWGKHMHWSGVCSQTGVLLAEKTPEDAQLE